MIRPEDLAGVLDAMLEGLQVLGPDWRYLHVNGPAARHGRCRPSDLLGRVITDCYPGIEHTEVFAAMRRSMTERVPQTMESAFRFADGSTGHFELRIEPVPQGICVLSIDVTDRRDAESARRSAEDRLAEAKRLEAIGVLAAGVAHDFNNYLMLILERAHTAAGRAGGPTADDLEAIVALAGASAELTRELLSCGSRAVLQREVVDLAELLAHAVPGLRSLVPSRVTIELDAAAGTRPVFADRGKLERIVTNLVRNASDAIAGRGTITVGVAAADAERLPADLVPGEYVQLTVRDTGTGISDDVRTRLFEPFFTTKQRGLGTGLGLATVFGLVKQHHGHVDVASAPGRGTVFSIHLPCVAANAPADPPRPPVPPRPGTTTTILVVDDTPEIGQLIQRQLECAHRVLLADSGERALELWRQHGHGVDLVLTDLMMPGLTGWDLIGRFKASRPDLRILCMSGYVVPPGDVPADVQYLEKPFTADQLRDKVRGMLHTTPPRA